MRRKRLKEKEMKKKRFKDTKDKSIIYLFIMKALMSNNHSEQILFWKRRKINKPAKCLNQCKLVYLFLQFFKCKNNKIRVHKEEEKSENSDDSETRKMKESIKKLEEEINKLDKPKEPKKYACLTQY